ncbi:MAG: gluconokinase [Candidatus Binatia bacterium]
MVVIVMGVTGAGKTEIGRRLADTLGWRFVEGDDFHSPANRTKLAHGIPLDDADRAPWLAALRAEIERALGADENAVVTSSALKDAYRRKLVVDPERVKLVHLTGPKELLEERLRHRRGHFADPRILASQLATLEPPKDAITVDVTPPPDEIVARIQRELGSFPPLPLGRGRAKRG